MSDEPSGQPITGEPDVLPRQSVARNAGLLLISQGFTWTLALVITAIQPRFLGPAGMGQLQLALSLWAIAGVFTVFGTANLVTVGLARRTDSAELARSAVALQIITYFLSAIGVIAFSLVAGYRGQLLVVVLIVGCTPLLSTFATVARATFFGLERMAWPSKVDMVAKVVSTIAVVVVLVLGGRTVAVAIVGVATALLTSGMMIVGLRRETKISLRPAFGGVRTIARRAYPFLLIEASVTVYQQIDTVILSLLVDDEQIGWYAVADTLMGSLIVVPTLLMAALFPTLARLTSESELAGHSLVRSGLRVMSFAGVAVGLGIAIVSGQLATLLFGEAFRESGPVIAIRALAMIVMYQTIMVGNYMMSINRLHRWTIITVIAIAVSVPLNLVLVPATERAYGNGAIGGALVYVFAEFVILIGAITFAGARLYDAHVLTAIAKAAVAGGLMLLATWWVRDVLIVVPIVIGAVVYSAALWLLRAFDDDERAMLHRYTSRITSRLSRS